MSSETINRPGPWTDPSNPSNPSDIRQPTPHHVTPHPQKLLSHIFFDDNDVHDAGEQPTPWYYVLVLADDGANVLINPKGRAPNALHMPDSEWFRSLGPQLSVDYRAEVCRLLDVDAHTHCLEQRVFPGTRQIVMTVLEISSKRYSASEECVWRHWPDVRADFEKPLFSPVLNYIDALLMPSSTLCHDAKVARPWYGVGYFNRVLPWIETAVRDAGFELRGNPEQLRSTVNASIYSIPVRGGKLYYKACPQGSDERQRTETIISLFPGFTDTLVASNVEHEAFICSDHGRSVGAGVGVGVLVDEILVQWAKLQQESVQHIDTLKTNGFPVCDAKWFRDGLKDTIEYTKDTRLFNDDEINKLENSVEFFDEVNMLWEQSGIPSTLVHGDFQEVNVALQKGGDTGMLFFDWDTAFIGWPLLELGMFRREAAYLKSWNRYTDFDTITRLATYTKPLVALRLAVLEVYNWRHLSKEDREENMVSHLRDYIASTTDFN